MSAIRRYSPAGWLPLLLLGVPGALSPARAQEPDQGWQVTYVVRPLIDSRDVSVTAVIRGNVAGGVLWRRPLQPGLLYEIARPDARDGFGQALRVDSHPMGWVVSGGSSGGMRLHYIVSTFGTDPVGAGGAGSGPGALYLSGGDLFLQAEPSPERETPLSSRPSPSASSSITRLEVVFDVPVSWRVVVPWEGFGRTYRPTSSRELWNTLVAAGDYRRQQVRAAGVEIVVGIQVASPGSDASLVEAVRRMIMAGQEFFGPPPATSYALLIPRTQPGGQPAVHLGRSLGLAPATPFDALQDPAGLHPLARGILAFWSADSDREPSWYNAGVRDYLAWMALLRQNLISPEVFGQRVLQAERHYREHPRADEWTFLQEQARRQAAETTGGDRLPSLAHSRGLLVALALDVTLVRLSAGSARLTDLVRWLYLQRRQGRGEGETIAPLSDADIMRGCAELTGGDYLDDFFRTLIMGTGRPPVAAALADILERERPRERRPPPGGERISGPDISGRDDSQ